MSQQISKPANLPEVRDSFPRIAAFFDAAEYIVERTVQLIMKAKYLIFGLAFLLFLIYEMAHFGKYLLSNWH